MVPRTLTLAREVPRNTHEVIARGALILACLVGGCGRTPDVSVAPAASAASSAAAHPSGQAPVPSGGPSGAPAPAASASASAAQPAVTCPPETRPIPGGRLWIGSRGTFPEHEDSPRFLAEVAPFCLDRTEVTVSAYAACVRAGACQPAGDESHFCNADRPDHDQHPINCVDWHQAVAFCKFRRARLPTEVEWEYAARGGSRDLPYPWGDGALDAHTCWKHAGGSCRVGEFPEDVFGLVDVIGNVWEWTDSWYGAYPFGDAPGYAKIYRGGSWSRRFDKWMSPRLRNRSRPQERGSHLGFRCALTLPGAVCPDGERKDGSGCTHGVREVDCPSGKTWNGARCARPEDPLCPPDRRAEPGRGCVLAVAPSGSAAPVDLSGVTSARSPEFDADCAAHNPGRPHAYRYAGGTHHARNVVSGGVGCKNRDVGVGWNSTCCP